MSLAWLPNAICVGRLLLVAPLVWTLASEQYVAALALLVVAGASDALDGFLAKTFHWRTRLGSLLDPAADKLLLVSVFVVLTWLGAVPLALTLIVVMRDIVIVLGALIYQLVFAPVTGEPTMISKLNTACQLTFVLFTITQLAFGWPAAQTLVLLGAAVVFTSVTSGMHYLLAWGRRASRSSRAAA